MEWMGIVYLRRQLEQAEERYRANKMKEDAAKMTEAADSSNHSFDWTGNIATVENEEKDAPPSMLQPPTPVTHESDLTPDTI